MNDALILWTIYDHPRDFPHHYVVRAFAALRGHDEPVQHAVACLYHTLDEARRDCQRNQADTCIPRDPNDDVTIIETWL